MDKQIFVQNIKKYCALRGIKPTIACAESGAGKDIINQLEKRGSIPSVERVQLLAQYLGVTVSELLGEPTPEGQARAALTEHLAQTAKDESKMLDYIRPKEPGYGDLIVKFNALSPDDQEEVLAIIEMKLARKLPRK